MEKIAAIYIRVSTDAQAEEGYSIDAQKEQLTAYCISKGMKNYEYYIDGGWSGSNINRPALQKLLKDIKDEKISHCIVYKLDRLSRSQKDTLFLIEDVFNPNAVDFVSMNESIDTATPTGKLMIGILSAFAQLERENIRLRTRMGMKERVKNGYWMGGGRIPFGYDYDSKQGILIPNQDAEKVKLMYAMYIDGKSAQDIANMLDLKYDKLVQGILKRKCNYGIIEYNGEEYQGRHQPIISKEIYEEAMSCMKKRTVIRTATSPNLLTGLVYCGKCGAKMRYMKWGKTERHKFFCYSQQKNKPYLVKDPNCTQEKVWADEVENAVLEYLFSLNEKTADKKTNSAKVKINSVNLLEEQYLNIQKKIKKLYLLFAEDDDTLLLETINEEKMKLKNIADKIEHEKMLQSKKEKIQASREILSDLKNTWKYMSNDEKQQTLRLLIKRIEINENDIYVEINI